MEQFQWMFKLYDSMSGPAKNITGALAGIEKQLKALPETTALVQEGFKRLIDGAMEIGKIGLEGGKFAVEALAFKESTLESFKLMLGTKEAALDFFNTAKSFGRVTPFETEDVVNSFKKLLGAGFTKQEVPIVFQAVGDVAAVNGFDKQIMDRLAYAFGQMKSGGGHMFTHALREIVTAGGGVIPEAEVFKNISKILGVDDATAREMAHKGKMTADVAIAAVMDTIQQKASGGKDLGQGMLVQATTIKGLLSTIKSAPMDLFLDMDLDHLKGFQGLKKFLQGLADTLNPASDAGTRMRKVLEDMVDAVGNWLGSFSLDDMINGFDTMIGIVRTLMDGFVSFKEGVMDVLQPTFDLMQQLDGSDDAANGFVDSMKAVGWVIGGILNVVLLLSMGINKAFEGFAAFSDIDWSFLWEQLKKLDPTPFFNQLKDRFVEFGTNLMQGLAAGIRSGMAIPFGPLAQVASGAVSAFSAVLGIHSPSKVFAQLGEYTTEGYAEGVERGGGNVDRAITSMVAVPAPGAGGPRSGNTFNVSVTVDGAGSNAETIARRLAEILPSQLASMFEQLAVEEGVA